MSSRTEIPLPRCFHSAHLDLGYGRAAAERVRVLVPLLLAFCFLPASLLAETGGPDPAGWSDAEKEEFLRTAEILETETLPTGVTLSSRGTLSNGTVTHDAHIQDFEFYRKRYKVRGRTFLNFWDTYRYNIAAYRLDRLLDLRMVPVSVERQVKGKPAAVTWWIDNFLMTLRERHEKKIKPPNISLWNDQRFQGWMFNQLIYNTDPNLGNYVISSDWKLWLIDFTRAFRTFRKLYNVKELGRIDRRLYESLQRLTEESLEEATAPYLGKRERKAILARRDLLLEHFDARIATEGEDAVICSRPGH